jgi:hypothetical protein
MKRLILLCILLCSSFFELLAQNCVGDITPPVFSSVPANINLSGFGRQAYAYANWIPPTATDNCSAVTVTSNYTPGIFRLGTTTVIYTARDANGNTATATFTVTVTGVINSCLGDTTRPSIVGCPANRVIYAPPGSSTGFSWESPIASDNCGSPQIFVNQNPYERYVTTGGQETVIITAVDSVGNTSECRFVVSVVASTNPPCPTLTGNTITYSCVGGLIRFTGAVPSGSSTGIEYQWMRSTFGCPSRNEYIPGETGQNLTLTSNPTTTTYYTRFARPVGCNGWSNILDVSNCITLGPNPCNVNPNCFNDVIPPVISNMPANITVTGVSQLSSIYGTANWTAPTATDNCSLSSLTSNYSSGTGFPLGINTVIYTARDASGNTSTASFTVNVLDPRPSPCPGDLSPPIFTYVPTNITVNSPTGIPIVVGWNNPIATDPCGPVTYTFNNYSGGTFPLGTTTIICTATDAARNSSTASFNVTVSQTTGGSDVCTNPTANIVGGAGVINITGLTTSAAELQVFSNWTPYLNRTLTTSTYSVTALPPGVYQVKLSVLQPGGTWPAVCIVQQNVTVTGGNNPCVNDTISPVIANCPANITVTSISGGNTVATWTPPTATDNCAVTSFISTYSPGFAFPRGLNPVFYIAEDAARHTTTCSFSVNVVLSNPNPCATDITPPVFANCPTNITVASTNGTNAVATWTPPTATDNCSTVTLTSNYASGAIFNVGATTVTYTARDFTGNTSICSFVVNITRPATGGDICASPATNVVGGLGVINITGITSASATLQVYTSNWVQVIANTNITTSTYTTTALPAGNYIAKLYILGAGGTWPALCNVQQNVTVGGGTNPCTSDITPPVFAGTPANISVTTASGATTAAATWTAPTATDNCSAVTISSNYNSGSIFPIGTTSVIYTARDASNNAATTSFTVTVSQNTTGGGNVCTNPTTNIVGGVGVLNITGITSSSAQLQLFTSNWVPVPNGNVAITTPTYTFTPLAAGSYIVKLTVLQAGGLWPALCQLTQNITVTGGTNPCTSDVTPPSISGLPANITVVSTNATNAVATWQAPTATDNCSAVTLTSNYPSGATFPVGTTSVVYTARDASNNSSTGAFAVTVTTGTVGGTNICTNPTANVVGGVGNITITGVTSAAGQVQIFTSSWMPVRTVNITSATTVVSGLVGGGYIVKIAVLNTGGLWPALCFVQENVTVSAGASLVSRTTNLAMQAFASERRAKIEWVANNGTVNDYTVVQKLDAIGNFVDMETLNASLTDNDAHLTVVYDQKPVDGDNYYRIKLVQTNGAVIYTDVKKVVFKDLNDFRVFPNPADDHIVLDLANYRGNEVFLDVYNSLGQPVANYHIEEVGDQPFQIETVSYNNGAYTIRVAAKGKKDVVKQVVIQK